MCVRYFDVFQLLKLTLCSAREMMPTREAVPVF